MAYCKAFRRRVLDFVANGGSKAEAARRFCISRPQVFAWLKQPADHEPGKPGPKTSRKYDQEGLRAEVEANPDALLRELAASRGVSIHSIFLALKRLGFVRKKNSALRRKSSSA
jgi:transposase